MVNFTDAPLNSYSWTTGAIAVYIFTIKSIISYKKTKNPLARVYIYLSFFFATGFLFFGFPGFLTTDTTVLKYTWFLADLSIQISILFALWLTWFIGFRLYLSLKYLIGFVVPLSIASLSIEFFTSTAHISQNPHIVQYTNVTAVLILQSVIYTIVAVPLSYFLLKQVPNQVTYRSKFLSLVSGLIPVIVTFAGITTNAFDRGADTKQSSIELFIFFIIFFLAQIPRPKKL